MNTATLPNTLKSRIILKLQRRRVLTGELAGLTNRYSRELHRYRPERIGLGIDETQGVEHFVLTLDGEWISSAYTIEELEDQLNDRLNGNTDILDCESTVRLGDMDGLLEPDNTTFPPTYRVVVADMY